MGPAQEGESQSLDVAILRFQTARRSHPVPKKNWENTNRDGRIYTFLFSSRGSLVFVVPTMEVTISAGMLLYFTNEIPATYCHHWFLLVSFLAGKGDVSLLVVLENPRSMPWSWRSFCIFCCFCNLKLHEVTKILLASSNGFKEGVLFHWQPEGNDQPILQVVGDYCWWFGFRDQPILFRWVSWNRQNPPPKHMTNSDMTSDFLLGTQKTRNNFDLNIKPKTPTLPQTDMTPENQCLENKNMFLFC